MEDVEVDNVKSVRANLLKTIDTINAGHYPPPPKYGTMGENTNYSYQGGPTYQPYGATAPPPTSTYIVSSKWC